MNRSESPRSYRERGPQRQRGVTLVEILITVVITSIGLLGVAGLHLTSLRAGQGAHVRSQATALAADIIDRMRANPERADAGEYNIAMTDNPPTTATGLVAKDKKQWLEALAAALPSGDGSVSRGMLNGRVVYTVTIQWAERADENNYTAPTTFVTVAEL